VDVLLAAAHRARLLAVLAGLAWLFGITPAVWSRLALIPGVVTALALDIYADRAPVPGPIRVTKLGGTNR
jgi:hypothetical protein